MAVRPVPPRWANLDIDLVTEIMNRAPCVIDRARMAAVCQAWLEAVARAEPLTFQLPSLLLPPADVTGVYCYLSGFRDHNMFPGPRYFGSYDGGWFFLAYGQTRGHRLFNIRTGESYELPDGLADIFTNDIHSMVVLAATLSFPPHHPGCAAAGIVTYQPDLDAPRQRHFAFWRPGDRMAVCDVVPAVPIEPGLEPEDVVYYRDSFHFLTQGGHILVCSPIFDGEGHIPGALLELMRFQEAWCTDEQFVRARYLVVSRGELLVVVRLAAHHHAPTSSFKVFRVILKSKTCRFEEVALCGRMLFLGRGCSRSYEVSQYPGFKDSIFFLDDRSFYDDAEMMFGGVNERQYPCNDIGRWSPEGLLPSHVEFYFPERVPSYNSPPAWLLP
ncbi:uncharacterized protein LOC100274863 [Zea mays]|jgi:hypothetical protein|uniref:KIB1-4 beta-propeller domain-containing protein n=1 Tax=Zea mays TaxID=4577 RepID=B4FR83_MAIZE|nr:uncharacterized protein LOC100274863 [Zea mays]ACF84626.1 unknown [Zea mays]ACL53202.1 unknown [Zea mays]AQK86601.1 hypothetical protein ZEAMMB73_Zm00001d038424 [Zea mays]|eukprot:NP_001281177.1 uncharacterized protein LOC100274863 [Zea mays]